MDCCDVCKKKEDLKGCTHCGFEKYCSKECQSQDWENHKEFCERTTNITPAQFIKIIFRGIFAPSRIRSMNKENLENEIRRGYVLYADIKKISYGQAVIILSPEITSLCNRMPKDTPTNSELISILSD